jgi:hypothetical protein
MEVPRRVEEWDGPSRLPYRRLSNLPATKALMAFHLDESFICENHI